MKQKPYPAYKPSGIEWLGDVPEHWEVKRCGIAYNIQLGKMLQPEASSAEDVPMPYFKALHVQWGKVTCEELPTMWASINDAKKYSVSNGDLLACEGGEVGRAAILKDYSENAIIQNSLHRVRSNGANSLIYLMYLIIEAASRQWFEILCNKATIAHFTGEKFAALRIPIPPLTEQQSISAFLDHETGRIDKLTAKKERLIELLREKRSALISHAVTKGLDPSVKLKPSGVEWLGEVPEHWEVKRLKHLFSIWGRIGYRGYTTDDLVDEGHGALALGASHITDKGRVDLSGPIFITWQKYYESPEIMVSMHDLIVVQRGSCGKVALVDFDLGPATINPSLILMKNAKAFPKFVLYVLLSGYIQSRITTLLSSTAVPMLSQEQVANFSVILPPLPEQQSITAFLDHETGKIDALIAKVEDAITRLKEYRTALISAAVTGKIDVREAA